METISRDVLTFLFNSIWQVPLITLVTALACRIMRNGPGSHRHAVCVAALTAAVLLPMWSIRRGETVRPMEISVSDSTSIAGSDSPARPTPRRTAPSSPPPAVRSVSVAQATGSIILGLYLAFLLYRLTRLWAAARKTLVIRRAAAPARETETLGVIWKRSMAAFGLKNVRLLSSAPVRSPLTIGARQCSIILPESLLGETAQDLLTTAIGHEMAHVARRDFVWNILCELLYLPVSFHPASRLLHNWIAVTREIACDELVTQRLMEPHVYARSLVRIAERMSGEFNGGYALGVFDGGALEERVRRLMERPAEYGRRARILLASALSTLAVCAVLASSWAISARAQSAWREEMKLAGDAYNAADYTAAVLHFDAAVKLEPSNTASKLFLANALLRKAAANPDNATELRGQAKQQYEDVLRLDPRNRTAMQGMMAVALDQHEPIVARDWAAKLIQTDPADKSGYYSLGMIDWAIVFPQYQRAKEKAGVKLEDSFIPDAAIRRSLRDQYLPSIDEGVRMLGTALQMDPSSSDAMAYMNLMVRLSAGLADTPEESAVLVRKADEWVKRALDAKRAAASQQPPPQRQLDVEGPPPGPWGLRIQVGPPPPPPPPPPRGGGVNNDR